MRSILKFPHTMNSDEKLELSEEDERQVIENFLKACTAMHDAFRDAGRALALAPDDGLLMPITKMLFPSVPVLADLVKQWHEVSKTLNLALPHLAAYRKLKTPKERVDFLNGLTVKHIVDALADIDPS